MSISSSSSFCSATSQLQSDKEDQNTGNSANKTVELEFEQTINWHPNTSEVSAISSGSKSVNNNMSSSSTITNIDKSNEPVPHNEHRVSNQTELIATQKDIKVKDANRPDGQKREDAGDETSKKTVFKDGIYKDQPKKPTSKADIGEKTPKPADNIMPLDNNQQIIGMLQALMTSVTEIKDDLKLLREDKERNTTEITAIKVQQSTHAEQIESLEDKSKVCNNKLHQLADVVAYQAQVIKEMQNKIHKQEEDSMKPNLIVHGITELEGENCTAVIKQFFKDKLELVHDLQIKKAYRLGKSKKRPILVCLKNAYDKGAIYANVSKLQGKTNEKKKPYRIEDQQPPRVRARKQQGRNMMWRNKQPTVLNKLVLSTKKGELLVDDKPYKSQILTPDVHKLLKLSAEEIEELEKVHIVKGETIIKETSQFTGYICDTSSFDQVNAAYELVRFQNLDARHIICACYLPGTNVVSSYDFCDDGEHEAGAFLLDYMVKAGQKCRTIFIVRHYDGTHIGQARFDSILAAAKSAVTVKPYNSITESYQFAWPQKRKEKKQFGAANSQTSSQTSDDDVSDNEIVFNNQQPDTRAWADRTPPVQTGTPSSSPKSHARAATTANPMDTEQQT